MKSFRSSSRAPLFVRQNFGAKSLAAVLCLAAPLVFCNAGVAQVLYGTLTGTVTDATGAVVPSAQVQALEQIKGVTQTATTDSAGIYRFNNILPGLYKITVSAPNFAPNAVENLRVDANTVRRVDIKLAVGSVQQNVIVTTAPPLLQTDTAVVQTQLSQAQLQTLPSVSSEGKNFQSLYKLVPGASPPIENNSAGGNPQRAMTSNVNGQSSQGNNTMIDGVLDAYPWLPNNVAYVPPTDAIETVNVVTNSYDAEQGNVGGAAINVQIKSGGNQFHGDAHEFHTDDQLKALNYFNPPTFHRPLNIFNQYGASVGGPIRKDKIFFFGDWESTRQTQAPSGGNPQTVPAGGLLYSQAESNGFFDFRGLQTDKAGNPVHLYDPRTGSPNGAGRSVLMCHGVADELCLSDIDPAALTMASLIPAPNQSGTVNNYIDSEKGYFHRNDFDGKVTYVASENTHFFGRYSYSGSDIFDPPALGKAGGNATNGGQNGNSFGRIQIVGLGATHTFSPTLLLDINAGYTRQRLNAEDTDIADNGAYGLNTLKIPGTNDPTNKLYWGIPAFQFTNYSNLGNPNTGNPFVFRDTQYVGNANLTWIRGRHNIRAGVGYTHAMLNHFQPQGGSFQTARGTFGFDGIATEQVNCSTSSPPVCTLADPPTTTQFDSYADFLLGLPYELGKAVQNVDPIGIRWSTWSWYVRDQWQATPKLNINYGLRWEFYPMAYSDHGGTRVLDTSTLMVLIGGNGGVPVDDGVNVGHGLFLPRLGITYRPTEQTVVRLGYGINADANNWRFLRNAYPVDTISTFTGTTYTQAQNSSFAPAGSLTGYNAVNGLTYLPAGLTLIPVPNTSSGRIPMVPNVSTTTIPLDFRRGYIHSFNATVEQNIAGFVFSLGYVGSRAIRPVTNLNVNAAPGGGGQSGRIINARTGVNYSDINSLTPYGNNYYDSLQSRLTRRLRNNSSVGLIYTWSKAIDFEDDEEINFILRPYPSQLPWNRAVAGFDRTHNFEAYTVWALPFGRGQRWATSGIPSALAGGWTFGGVLSALSGTPINMTDSSSGTLNAPGNTQSPNQISNVSIINGRPYQNPSNCASDSCRYFTIESFAHDTVPGQFGNTARDSIRGPGYFDLDASIYRNFKITERVQFQFEADAFGVTNTPHFGNPISDINNANFGKVTGSLATTNASLGGSGGERQFWFGGKIVF